MPNYEAVSLDTHKNKRWKQNTNFKFTAQDALCPIVAQEAPSAIMHLPIAFSRVGEHFGLFAIQGLEAGKNYLVDAEGQWRVGYVPAAYRSYPFALAEGQVLCFNTDSGLQNNTEGTAFFDDMGEPTPEIRRVLDFLAQLIPLREKTLTACLLLEELDLLEPWSITIKRLDKETPVEGLYRVNEAKFNTIDAETLIKLRDNSVLPLIFCQLLSMQNMSRIAQLGSTGVTDSELVKELEFDFANDHGNINLEGI